MGIRLPYQLNFVASLESSATINLEKHELLQSVRTSRGAGVCDLVIVKSKLSKSIYEFKEMKTPIGVGPQIRASPDSSTGI